MLTHLLRLITVLIFALLQACSGPGKGGGGFPDDSGSGPSIPGTEPVETVGVIIEANGSPISSPVTVVALNYDFTEIAGLPDSMPDHTVVTRSAGGYTIEFGGKLIEQLNLVIRTRFQDGNVLYAPLHSLSNTNDAITVSHKSNYVLKKLFSEIDSIAELDTHLPCASSVSDCPNQSQVKSELLANISETAQQYEVDIPSGTAFSEVEALLDSHIDFRTHIETAVKEITRGVSPIAKGTRRSIIELIDENGYPSHLTYNQQYNSLWFGLSFGDHKPDNLQAEIKIATLTSTIAQPGTLGSEPLPIYPYISQTTTLLDIHREVLLSNIPFTRTTLTIDEIGGLTRDTSEPVNKFELATSDSFLSREGFLLYDRSVYQQIKADTGWEFNPLYSKLYRANSYEVNDSVIADTDDDDPDFGADPTWLTSANFSVGASYELGPKPDGVSKRPRLSQLEAFNLFSWEIHGLETDSSFSTNDINGKTYGVIGYSLKLDSNDNVLELYGETLRWSAANNDMQESQPTPHYRSYTLSRDKDYNVAGVNEETGINFGDHDFNILVTEKDTNGSGDIEGLIGLDGGTNAFYGHSTQNGKHLAYAFNTPERGRGLLIATQLRSSATPVFSGESYQLQGNSFGMTSSVNRLQNFNSSTLTLTDVASNGIDCQAVLYIEVTRQDHIVAVDQNILEPVTRVTPETKTSSACRLSGSEIELTFDDVLEKPLTLRGFVTRQGSDDSADTTPGKLITFLWKQSDSIGLVFANLTQDLSASFDP